MIHFFQCIVHKKACQFLVSIHLNMNLGLESLECGLAKKLRDMPLQACQGSFVFDVGDKCIRMNRTSILHSISLGANVKVEKIFANGTLAP